MKLLQVVFLAFVIPHARAQFLHCSPDMIILPLGPGDANMDGGGSQLKFKYTGALSNFGTPLPDASNFAVLVPSSGTTPAALHIGLNPSVVAQLQPGGAYTLEVLFTTVDQTPPNTAPCLVKLIVPTEPPPSIQSVVNAASLQPSLSPGAEVSILGSHLTGPTLSTNYDATASYPTSVAGTSVTFNGAAAPLLYLSPGQINAIVPYALAGQTSVQVVVQRFGQVSATVTLPLQDTAPGIFTASQSGAGQGAILQQGSDGQFTYNSSSNPAARGMALGIFATGAGVWAPPPQSDVFLFGESFTTQSVSVMIGGQPAKVLYAGTQGTTLSPWSVLQVNAVVPAGVISGPQPVILKIGAHDNSPQQVTVAVQ